MANNNDVRLTITVDDQDFTNKINKDEAAVEKLGKTSVKAGTEIDKVSDALDDASNAAEASGNAIQDADNKMQHMGQTAEDTSRKVESSATVMKNWITKLAGFGVLAGLGKKGIDDYMSKGHGELEIGLTSGDQQTVAQKQHIRDLLLESAPNIGAETAGHLAAGMGWAKNWNESELQQLTGIIGRNQRFMGTGSELSRGFKQLSTTYGMSPTELLSAARLMYGASKSADADYASYVTNLADLSYIGNKHGVSLEDMIMHINALANKHGNYETGISDYRGLMGSAVQEKLTYNPYMPHKGTVLQMLDKAIDVDRYGSSITPEDYYNPSFRDRNNAGYTVDYENLWSAVSGLPGKIMGWMLRGIGNIASGFGGYNNQNSNSNVNVTVNVDKQLDARTSISYENDNVYYTNK